MKMEEIITDGDMDKRQVVNQEVLKCASGYSQGYTSNRVVDTKTIEAYGDLSDKEIIDMVENTFTGLTEDDLK